MEVDVELDQIVTQWHEAVRMFFDSPDGRMTLREISLAEQPIFIGLLESFIPLTGNSDLDRNVVAWRDARIERLRLDFKLSLYTSSADGKTDIGKRFCELTALARGNVLEVKRQVAQTVEEMLGSFRRGEQPEADLHERDTMPADGDPPRSSDRPTMPADAMPMPPLRPSERPTLQAAPNPEDLARTRESVSPESKMAVLESEIHRAIEEASSPPVHDSGLRTIPPPPSLPPSAEASRKSNTH